ncbi:stalk domain-containing protein [Cohnella yongneupensis]|uniref:Stalk domain-containing protein n=1 Tax=Cohnella yongneupensis TaxID=425006 RepID=A0ABW0QYA6_9BACL
MQHRRSWTKLISTCLTIVLGLGLVLASAFAAEPANAVDATTKPKVVQLASGVNHTLAILDNGMVMAWGDNKYGQLGNGTSGNTNPTPALVTGLKDVVAVAGGKDHSMALTKDGTVWTWGANYDAQLGNGSQSKFSADYTTIVENHDSLVPTQVRGLDHVTAIAAGWNLNYALKDDGTVWGWGSNLFGGLGVGLRGLFQQTTPLQVNKLHDVISISAGWNHGHAIQKDGTSWSWGFNDSATAGDGTVSLTEVRNNSVWTLDDQTKITPVEIAGNHHFQMIAPMHNGSCYAIEADGTLWYWGVKLPSSGGTQQYEKVPVQIPGMSDVKGIYAVSDGAYALKKDGTVWTTSKTHEDFTQMKLPKISSVSAGGWFHALALAEDGSVWAWGANSVGQLGDGTTKRIAKASPAMLTAFYAPVPPVVTPPVVTPPVVTPPVVTPPVVTPPVVTPPVVTSTVYVNGKLTQSKLNLTPNPPMLLLADAVKLIGAKSAVNKKVYTITRGKAKLELSAGSVSAKLNGKAIKLAQAPLSVTGGLWIPVSALDLLGAKTTWNAKTKRLDIKLA